MNGSLQWNMEELQNAYNKLGDCITQLKEYVEKCEKSNEELKKSWVTTKSASYFEEASKVKTDALKMINEYENAREQLRQKIEILRTMDEE